MVPQDPRLFTATVWENIALGLGPLNQEVAMEGGRVLEGLERIFDGWDGDFLPYSG